MKLRHSILLLLTLIAALLIGTSLFGSLNEPQFQTRLELYQTDLVLHASELQLENPNFSSASQSLLGEKPLKLATEAYDKARQSVQTELEQTKTKLEAAKNSSGAIAKRNLLTQEVEQQIQLQMELALRIGILQAVQGDVQAAKMTWQAIAQQANPALAPLARTAEILSGLWSSPPQILNNADGVLKKNLDGWFRYQALLQSYQLQQREQAALELQVEEQAQAARAFSGLTIATALPVGGGFLGTGLLLFLLGQWWLNRKQALLAADKLTIWSVPWGWESILEVLLGFLLVGQALIPLAVRAGLQGVSLQPEAFSARGKALFYLGNYVLVAIASLGILYGSIKPHLPSAEPPWLRVKLAGKWWLWGLGGYLVAIPLVTLVSLVNQSIWQGRGGSNPLLPIALQSKDGVALALFFVMAAIAAPIFEEILFRGFLLPSLAKYMPVGGAIGLSAVMFAVAHLSFSEVLPLAVLGMILGFVYTRSQNLLASIMLHSLWNAGTLISLFVLGGATSS